MQSLDWPDISFGPCNLYSFPACWKLDSEFMRNLSAENSQTSVSPVQGIANKDGLQNVSSQHAVMQSN
jgi:hypothetical protein